MTVCYFTASGNCLYNCPQKAIHLKKEASEARFRNENVSLADIIAANE